MAQARMQFACSMKLYGGLWPRSNLTKAIVEGAIKINKTTLFFNIFSPLRSKKFD